MIPTTILLHFAFHSDGSFLELLFWGALLYGAFYVALYAVCAAYLIVKHLILALYEDFGDLVEWIREKREKKRIS